MKEKKCFTFSSPHLSSPSCCSPFSLLLLCPLPSLSHLLSWILLWRNPTGWKHGASFMRKSIRKQNLKIVWLFQDMNATILRKSFCIFRTSKLRGEMTNGIRGCRCMNDWQNLSRQGSWYLFYFKCLQPIEKRTSEENVPAWTVFWWCISLAYLLIS